MATVTVQFLGSGDAFGSGGRLQTCICVQTSSSHLLVDCGTSSLIAMRRYGIEPNRIDLIVISHLHGDHFGGLPFVILDAQLISKRTRPLVIAGPPGLGQRLKEAMEVLFPGSSRIEQGFGIEIIEMVPEQPQQIGAVSILPYEVAHACGAPPLALRITCGDRVITYSGDTEWTPALIPAARDADLLIAEAYFFDKRIKYHLDYQTLMARLDALRPKRLVLTHMSRDMLDRVAQLDCEAAEDGYSITL